MSEMPRSSSTELPADIELLFAKKRRFHRDQAKLPFEEKIRRLVELQKIAVNASKGKKDFATKRVWVI